MKSTEEAVLSIDIGTGSTKAIIVDHHGHVLGRGESGYAVSRPRQHWAEQDPDDWWRATVSAVRAATGLPPEIMVCAIGLTGQMHGSVFLDRNRKLLRPAIIWEDTRSGEQASEIEERVGKARLLETVGSPIATGFQAASILWVQQHEPEVWDNTEFVLLPKDYLRLLLTGDIVSEPSDASSTTLFDITERTWSTELLNTLSIDIRRLPPILPSSAISGMSTKVASEQLGIPSGLPVVAGGGDAPLAMLGAGVAEPATLMTTISSGSQAMLPSAAPVIDMEGLSHTWCSALPPESGAGWYRMAATMSSGSALKWISTQLSLPTIDLFAFIESWANEIAPGSDGLLFLPYLAGERSPHMDPLASGAFFGLTASHDHRHLVRAVMEGTMLALLDATEPLLSSDQLPDNLILTGGGSQSDSWSQIVSDVFGIPVRVSSVTDGSAYGAAMLAAHILGWIDLPNGAARWAGFSKAFAPEISSHNRYRGLLQLFRQLYENTSQQMHALRKFKQ